MAKTGRAVAKLTEKSKQRAMKHKLGTHNAIVARTRSTYAEKVVAFELHKQSIHGFHKGSIHNEGGRNPCPRVTYTKREGDDTAVTFRGDGLPCDALESARAPKSNAERAKEDKRQSIKSEAREGWKPERYRTKWMIARGL